MAALSVLSKVALLLLSVGTPAVSVPSVDASPNDEAEVWVRAHQGVVRVWDKMGFSRELLTRNARRCIDQTAVTPTGPIDGGALRRCEAAEAEAVGKQRAAKRQRDYEETRPEAIKRWLGAVLGYRVATMEDRREDARAEITKQRKYARVGGVLNKSAVYEQQERIRGADEAIEWDRQYAKENGVKVLGRTDKRVARVGECLDSSYGQTLSDSIAEADIGRIFNGASSFAVEGQDCLWIVLLIKETEPR